MILRTPVAIIWSLVCCCSCAVARELTLLTLTVNKQALAARSPVDSSLGLLGESLALLAKPVDSSAGQLESKLLPR